MIVERESVLSPPARELRRRIESRSAVVAVVGLGYVGLPLVRAVHEAGFSVLGFDTDSSKIEMLDRGETYIKHLGDEYEFSGLSRRPVEGILHTSASIEDKEAIKPAFEGIDTVIHLGAWNTDVFDWDGTMAVTVQGTLNVYEAAREAGVRRILQASSGCTQLGMQYDDSLPYGQLATAPEADKPAQWDMVTIDDPVRPDSPYAIGKLFGENLGRLYADLHDISTMVYRDHRG